MKNSLKSFQPNSYLDYEQSVFVPGILRALNSLNIMQIRERNEEGMGERQEKKPFFFLFLRARRSPIALKLSKRRKEVKC